jgi:S1-C subfamily serine protease
MSLLFALACAAPVAHAQSPQDGIAAALDYTVTLDGDGVYGAGVLLDAARGLVLTNWHVVEDMKQPRAAFRNGAPLAAKVLDFDRELDLALLQIAPQKRAVPTWGAAEQMRPGDDVYAIGSPRHLAFTVSRGIVSFVGRVVDGMRYLQTDLPINDGNSGGPVVNGRGELVGLMTFVYKRAQGLSFAVPIDYARKRFAKFFTRPARG